MTTPLPSHLHATLIASGLIALAMLPSVATGQSNDRLWDRPVAIGNINVTLPPPSMPDGLDKQRQSDILKAAAGKYSIDRFTRNSIVAPLHLQRTTIKDSDGKRVGHQVDLWFVAHGRIDAIKSKEMFASLVNAEKNAEQSTGDRIPEAELTKRGIHTASQRAEATTSGDEVGYYRFSLPVLDRVIVEGVVESHSSTDASSYLAGVTLADQFDGDAEFPNQWKHSREDSSRSAPYSGCAAYAKATKLIGHEGAILVECHAVIHEPEDWFGGANLLGSKLPIAVQNAVRSFRRTLSKQ